VPAVKRGLLGNRPTLRFLLWFVLLLLLVETVYVVFLIESRAMEAYLEFNTSAAASLLGLLGSEVRRSGSTLFAEGNPIRVALGCDGSQPILLLSVAVLAFPASARWKLLGVIGGITGLLLLNVVRIASLVWLDSHHPSLFEDAHLFVWPAIFMLVALLLWTQWIRLSTPPPPEP
jgi:exosortase/archaeosortase family protein